MIDVLTQLKTHALITQRIQTYTKLNDSGNFYELINYFTQDAEYIRPSQPETIIKGKDQILASFLNRPLRKTRHIVSNISISYQTSELISVDSQIILFSGEQGHTEQFTNIMVGGFKDEMVLFQDNWYFSKHVGYLDFSKTLV